MASVRSLARVEVRGLRINGRHAIARRLTNSASALGNVRDTPPSAHGEGSRAPPSTVTSNLPISSSSPIH